ncbi:MAG: hypothetical protein V1645_03075 [archaeon]
MGKIYQTFNLDTYDAKNKKLPKARIEILGSLTAMGYDVLFSDEMCFAGVPHSIIVGFDSRNFRDVKGDFHKIATGFGLGFKSGTFYVGRDDVRPLELILADVKPGDHVKVYLQQSHFVGYVWRPEGKYKEIVKGKTVVKDTRESFLKNTPILLGDKDSEIFLSSFNPNGTTGDLCQKVQYVGLNVKKKNLAGIEALGYEVLERGKPED